MFAVPGWSVDKTRPKTQVAAVEDALSAPQHGKPSKKRKRTNVAGETSEIGPDRLEQLWDRVIEGKPAREQSKGPKKQKRRKKPETADQSEAKDEAVSTEPTLISDRAGSGEIAGVSGKAGPVVDANGKSKKKSKSKAGGQASAQSRDVDKTSAGLPASKTDQIESRTESRSAKAATHPSPTLTPLQASMRQKLISARFRHINETLYTTPSASALALFEENPVMFSEYHEGFRSQVAVWPENPIDSYISQLLERGRVQHRSSDASTPQPLPRTARSCRLIDLGCGEAKLAQALALRKTGKKLRIEVRSFDLQSPNDLVEKADIRKLPMADATADLAVFCLALMGTNWIDFVEEAWRVLRWKGELWIAETRSRFVQSKTGSGASKGRGRVTHSVGNRQRLEATKKEKKKDKDRREEDEDRVAAVEVDGLQRSWDEGLYVDGFIEVLRRRGFVLHGSVDASNKMFIKMTFVKGCTPSHGKNVPTKIADHDTDRVVKPKFLDAPAAQDDLDEATVLKPCVYKLR